MMRRGLRKGDGRVLAGAAVAGLLAVLPGPARPQGSTGAQRSAEVTARTALLDAAPRPIRVTPRWSGDGAVSPVAVGRGLPRIRLYRPPGAEPEPLRAAVAAEVTTALRLSGTAVYHPRPAVTVLDLEAHVRTAAGPSLTLRMVSLHHLPGRELPLRFRGRELRLTMGLRLTIG